MRLRLEGLMQCVFSKNTERVLREEKMNHTFLLKKRKKEKQNKEKNCSRCDDAAPASMTRGQGLNSKFSAVVRHGGGLGTVIQTVFSFGGFFFMGDVSLRTNLPPHLEWLPFPPLVAAVLITPKGAESPGSSRIGVIGALVCFFLSI